MTFRKQLIAGHAVSLLLIASTAATSIVALRVTSSTEDRIAHELADELDVVQHLRFLSEQLVATSRGYLLTGKDSYRERFEGTKSELDATLRELRTRPLDDIGRMHAAAVDQAAQAYAFAADEGARKRAVSLDADAVVPFFDRTLKPRRDAFETQVEAFADYERSAFDALLERSRSIASQAELVLVAAAILAIGLGLTLAGFAVHKVSTQFDRLVAARRIADAAVAARDEILAVVSHDLKNPLSSMALAASLLDEETSEEARRMQLRVVHNATERMQHMIDNLLATARLDGSTSVLRREPCFASELLESVTELFQTRAVSRQIALRAESTELRVPCDRERLLEVLSNLVGNALDHTPQHGTVVIRGERRCDDIRFSVSDTGPGIPLGHLPYVFDRYWQGPSRGAKAGLGLGLYICKRLVEAHDGLIGVDSAVGKGTTFWFTIPASSDHHPRFDS